MPKYSITDPRTGKVVTVTGDKPPTQADADGIFQAAGLRQTAPVDSRTGVQKVADFFGLGTTARNVGALGLAGQGELTQQTGNSASESFQLASTLTQQARQTTNVAQKRKLLDQARAIMQGSAQNMEQFQSELAQKQQVAGVTEQDLQRSPDEFALRRGVGQTAELASYLTIPGAKGATTGARIVQAGARGAMAGGLQGLAGATRTAETAGEAVGQTALGATAGLVTGAALQGVGEFGVGAINKIKSLKGSAKQKAVDIYSGTLNQNIKDKKFYQQYGGTDKVIKDSIKYEVAPTKNGVIKQLEKYGDEYNRIIEQETKSMENTGKRINITQAFENAKKRIKDKLGYDEQLMAQANKWFDDNAAKYTKQSSALPKSANKLRKNLDQRVGDILTADAVGQDAARKAFASELRMAFKEQASAKTKDAIQKYHLLSGLAEAMQKEPKIGITEATYAALSPGTGIANLGELLIGKAIRSPGLKRAVASQGIKSLSGTTKQISPKNIPTQVTNPMFAAINRALENERNNRQERKRL